MYLEYDFSAYEEDAFERVKDMLKLVQSTGNSVSLWQKLPAWAQAGFLDLSNPEERLKFWGKREMLDLGDPQDRITYDRFCQSEKRWDWESWLEPLETGFWKPEIDYDSRIIRIAIDEFPSGVIGPLNYIIGIAGAENLAPDIKFDSLKRPNL